MTRKNKRLLLFVILLLFSCVILALGLKYFPFTRVVKMPAGSENEFVDPEKIVSLPPNTLYYDFEIATGKEMPGGFYKGIAHSGQYSVKAFGQNSFSVAVERNAGEIGVNNLKAVGLSAWIYVFPTDKEVKGNFVFTASNEVGVNVCWEAIWLVEPEIPRGKWFKISKYIDLTPVTFKPGYKLQVYFWNNSSTDILVDDYFIAFGGAVDRRGDSARVDMTRPAGYVPKFNFPPFTVSMLERETVDKPINPKEIGPDDLVIAGNFFNSGNDGLVVAGKDGRLASYAYCPDTRGFLTVTVNNQAALASLGKLKKILKGKFLQTRDDQLILVGDKSWAACVLTPPEQICKGEATRQATLKITYKSETPGLSLFPGDFNGDRRAEILAVAANGSWRVISFEPESSKGIGWKVITRDEGPPSGEWDSEKFEIGISAGRFYPSLAKDVVLTITRNRADGEYSYSLLHWNYPGKGWNPLFSKKQDFIGKTIGLDTLKPADQFFTMSGDDNKPVIYRYNRDWRYDMKELRFSDTAFSIISTVDFNGYEKDQNPKYYETLKLVPGNFLDPGSSTFMVIGHVSPLRKYQSILPDFVQLYSMPVIK